MVFQKDLTPLGKGGAVKKHKGKGSSQAPMASRDQIKSLSRPPTNTMNDYAKATPMPQGFDTDQDGM